MQIQRINSQVQAAAPVINTLPLAAVSVPQNTHSTSDPAFQFFPCPFEEELDDPVIPSAPFPLELIVSPLLITRFDKSTTPFSRPP